MRRGQQQAAFANPVLIGAVTVLIAIVAVFLAYNANNGLPFVPTRELKVDIPNGAAVVAGNDVMEGGDRVGLVSDTRPVVLSNGVPSWRRWKEKFGTPRRIAIARVRLKSPR